MSNFKRIIGIGNVYIRENEIIITGNPEEEEDFYHNCDEMGCTSVEHVLLRGQFRFLQKGYDAAKQEKVVIEEVKE